MVVVNFRRIFPPLWAGCRGLLNWRWCGAFTGGGAIVVLPEYNLVVFGFYSSLGQKISMTQLR